MKRVLAVTVTAVVLLLLVSSWRFVSAAPEPLRLGTCVWLGYEPLHVRAQTGALSRSFKLVEYVSASQVMRAFENGEIDGAALTLDEALRLSASTHDVRLVVVTDYSNGGDALVTRAARPRLEDLRGARVGVERTALGALMLTRALEHAALTVRDVTIVPLNVNEHETGWDEGRVDAVVTFEPAVTRLKAKGGLVVFSSAELPRQIVDVLVLRASRADRQPDVVSELRREWYAARATALSDLASFDRLASPRLQLPASELGTLRKGLEYPEAAESERAIAGGLRPIALTLASLMREGGIATVSDADVMTLIPEGAP